MELESLWHVYTFHGEEVEPRLAFEARVQELWDDLITLSQDFDGIPEDVVRRIIDVESETRELLCLYESQTRLAHPPGMRMQAHRAIWGRDRIRAGSVLAWNRGHDLAVAQFVATMRIAELPPEEQGTQLSRFLAECEQTSQSSPSSDNRTDQTFVPEGLYFTDSESCSSSDITFSSGGDDS